MRWWPEKQAANLICKKTKDSIFDSLVVICVQKERKLLQVKRLDLDAAKTRLKKARMADARAAVSKRTSPSMHALVCCILHLSVFLVNLMLMNKHCSAFLKIMSQLPLKGRNSVCPSGVAHKSWLMHRVAQHETDHFISCGSHSHMSSYGKFRLPFFLIVVFLCSDIPFFLSFDISIDFLFLFVCWWHRGSTMKQILGHRWKIKGYSLLTFVLKK